MKNEEVVKYSTHSIRVWACIWCISLDKVGKSSKFVKKRLNWMGESYCVYLRNTNKINHQHGEALKDSSQAVIDLINSDIDSNIEPSQVAMPKHQESMMVGTETSSPLLSKTSVCNQLVFYTRSEAVSSGTLLYFVPMSLSH